MKAYNKAVLAVEEFVLNADIAEASVPESESTSINGGGGNQGLAAGIEFEILANGNDEI